jgi:hypothetical protein
MHEIYLEDQADREPPGGDLSKLDWAKIGPRDAARRAEVRRMIEAGKLKTGVELREASFVFQHGSEPNDFLLAHVLATAALVKGDAQSAKISAMTLDRYLHKIGQAQVFGNDYQKTDRGLWTQAPFNRQLVPAALRAVFCVPNERVQGAVLDALQHNREPDLSKYEAELPCRN